MHDHLVTKVNAIDTKIPRTSELVTKTQSDSDKQSLLEKIKDVGKKTYNTNGVVRKTHYKTRKRYLKLLD